MEPFSSKILAWYAQNKRDLPWRKTTDPYKILVSELMLQQTQVTRVIPIYEEFLKQWPDLPALANADLGDVLRAWKGLGYNRRAKFLWELSRHPSSSLLYRNLTKDHLPALQELPGIGHYTAAAILAFAHNRDALVVDTNIRRIHKRYFGDASDEQIQSTAPPGQSRDWHNALMDFGSLVCTKKPQCASCPLQKSCAAYKTGNFTVVVPKQSTFAGSNRFYRGRILAMLRETTASETQLLSLGPREKVENALMQLVREGLVKTENNTYSL